MWHASHPGLGSREGQIRELLSGNKAHVSYGSLRALLRRSVRNGHWTAKARGGISNMRLIVQTLRIALELVKSFRSRIASAGKNRAIILFQTMTTTPRPAPLEPEAASAVAPPGNPEDK
jgi:hypothetical protein